MTFPSPSRRALPVLIACALSMPHYSAAQSLATTVAVPTAAMSSIQEQSFTQQQLDQMLAPVALYPDALLSQVLMASTYPLEVVEAARWCEGHPALTGEALQKGVSSQAWDASVKSLCAFRSVLDRMSRDLTWTDELGEAFVGQQAQVMDEIQHLRNRARYAGSLVSNSQQIVTVDGDYIMIAPRDPQVVYVPTYDPNVVYGQWWWSAPPHYPAYWWPPGGSAWYWGAGIGIGLGLWGIFDWHHHLVNVDIDHYNRLYGGHLADGHWRFDPAHRAGVGFSRLGLDHVYGHAGGDSGGARVQFRADGPGSPAHGFGEHAAAPAFGGEHFGGLRGGGGFHGSGGRR